MDSPRDATEYVRGRTARVVQEIGNIVGRHRKIAEAVKQVRTVLQPRPARDVVSDLTARKGDRSADLSVQARRGDWRYLGLA